MSLRLISAGAARGLVAKVQAMLLAPLETELHATFGPAGAVRSHILSGDAWDVVIVTTTILRELAVDGHLAEHSIVPLGKVATGIAVRGGRNCHPIKNETQLRASLIGASGGIFVPDTRRSTAGAHLIKILTALNAHHDLSRLREFPDGASAMQALAACDAAETIGCTQISEMIYTSGLTVIGPLPPGFDLDTVYSIALSKRSIEQPSARMFLTAMSGAESEALRRASGFDALT
jgi:molybdate transport system substrate-binding protein